MTINLLPLVLSVTLVPAFGADDWEMCYSADFSTGWNTMNINFNPPGVRYGLCVHEVTLLKPKAPARNSL